MTNSIPAGRTQRASSISRRSRTVMPASRVGLFTEIDTVHSYSLLISISCFHLTMSHSPDLYNVANHPPRVLLAVKLVEHEQIDSHHVNQIIKTMLSYKVGIAVWAATLKHLCRTHVEQH